MSGDTFYERLTARTARTSTKVAILSGLISLTILFFIATAYWHDEGNSDGSSRKCPQALYPRGDYDFKPDIWERNLQKLDREGDETDFSVTQKQIRILCWVMTYPRNHKTKAVHVKATWGKRFTPPVLFMSSAEDLELPTIALPVAEGRENLWSKTKEAFKYIYSHYNGTYDWVLKADDDTYVIEENLRYLLSLHDPNEPLYLGCLYKKYVKKGFMSGGPGYVLSKEAVKRFVVDGLEGGVCCDERSGTEDVGMGLCLGALGVKSVDTRDRSGHIRFHPVQIEELLNPVPSSAISWYPEISAYPVELGVKCCSNWTVSFHYVSPAQMYLLDFFIYHLRVHGANRDNPSKERRSIVADSRGLLR